MEQVRILGYIVLNLRDFHFFNDLNSFQGFFVKIFLDKPNFQVFKGFLSFF